MKKLAVTGLLLGVFALSLAAQQREEGMAICYQDDITAGFFVSHRIYPFGTKLVVTNPINKVQAAVQVGGRPDPSINAMLEISHSTAEKLGIVPDTPAWVWVEPVHAVSAPPKPAMRIRMGLVKQTGIASIQRTGKELTAFHPSIPIGTKVKLTSSSRDVIVIIKGRIQASRDRIIDISPRAAQELGIQRSAQVNLETIPK
jgi:rare lipoprotein A (peptidoglycan hydrolase)